MKTIPSNESTTIALDCDGVLLDYSTAYATAWERAFGTRPVIQNGRAYWPMDRWGIPRLIGESLERFRSVFDEEFWSTIPAVPGAVEACHLLESQGIRLVCVTALANQFASARLKNLGDLGFPIDQVIATGNDASVCSPKAAALASLKPMAFVDDFAPYLVGVDDGIHKALIVRDPVGSPNVGDALQHSHSQHDDLLGFARWWIARSDSSPGYEPDDGPLTEGQLAALKKDVQASFPRGTLLDRKSLFDDDTSQSGS
jgi:phosphoglycolate phosphatase-like HAD superfamily hydrolase